MADEQRNEVNDGLRKLGKREQTPGREVGTGAGTKCANPDCGELLVKKMLDDMLGVCPRCGYHHRLGAARRIEITADPGTFEETSADIRTKDILHFRATKTYEDSLRKAEEGSGQKSAFATGRAKLKGHDIALGVCDTNFIMASMGSVMGEKFVRLAELAIAERRAMIVIAGSGGARMQEGLFSLMQMGKTSAALAKLHQERLPYIVVCTDPTTAGVWASWASLGDVIVAEQGALIGFTGPRVIKTTINCELPEGFQRSEFLLEHGQVDLIVHREQLRDELAGLLDKLVGRAQ